MPICEGCGSTYADTLQACPSCGQAAQVVCPSCHRANQVFKVAEIETRPDLQNTALLEKLSFQPKPAAPEINGILTVLGVLLMFASLFALVRIRTGSGPVIFGISMLLAVACFYKARVNKVQADAYLAELNKWRAAKARWDLLYYCPACNAVFLPGQSACSPADQIAEYLPEAQ